MAGKFTRNFRANKQIKQTKQASKQQTDIFGEGNNQ